MKRNTQLPWMWGVLLLSTLTLLAPTANAQVSVSTLAAPVNTLTINDLDYLNSTTPKWLFTITISSPRRVDVIMTISLDVLLADGTTYMNAAQFISLPFEVQGTRTITNLELGRGRGIAQSEYRFNPQAKAAFQDIALPSGSMPAGSYKFTVEVREHPEGRQDSKDFTFVLTNPSSPVLLAPAEGEMISEEFPLFEWQYDGARAAIAIFEQLPGQRSLEETASGTPHIRATVTGRSFRYPATGARALKPGRTYVWYVAGLIAAAGGTDVQLRSELRSFTVSTSQRNTMAWLIDDLERALPPHYKSIFDQIRAQNYSPSGTFRLNGSPISLGDLLKVLNDIRANSENVNSVNLE